MNDVQVSVFGRTDVGMHRSGNEDSFLVVDLTAGTVGLGPDVSTHQLGERGSLMIVSDGMGGAAAGEIASEMAVETMRQSLSEMPSSTEISDQLRSAAEIANDRIWNHAQENPELSGMGATLTAVLVQGTTAYIAQVGDSRAYLIRRGQVKQLTKDQSLAQMLVDSGAIKPDQMDSVPQNVIMQAMGTQPVVKVAMSAVQLFRNDCLVICSDGLSNKIHSPNELREMIQDVSDLTEACRLLIDKANERGGEDNITVIIARFDGEALYSASESSSITGSFRALNQGYTSDYFSGSDRAEPAPPVEIEVPESEQKQITAMLNSADLARFGSTAPPAATDDTAQFKAPTLPGAAADLDDDFRTRPTAERSAPDDFSTRPTEERPALKIDDLNSRPTEERPALKIDDFSSRPTEERPALKIDDFNSRPTEERPALKIDDFSTRPTAERPASPDDDFSTRPTAERPAIEDAPSENVALPLEPRKRGYAVILIIALVSLLLLGATAFFVYSTYVKSKPPAVEQQQETEQ